MYLSTVWVINRRCDPIKFFITELKLWKSCRFRISDIDNTKTHLIKPNSHAKQNPTKSGVYQKNKSLIENEISSIKIDLKQILTARTAQEREEK